MSLKKVDPIPEDQSYYPIIRYWQAFGEVFGVHWWMARTWGINPKISMLAAQVMVNDMRRVCPKYKGNNRLLAGRKRKRDAARESA